MTLTFTLSVDENKNSSEQKSTILNKIGVYGHIMKSFGKNHDRLTVGLHCLQTKPSIVSLTETWFSDNDPIFL